MGSVDYQDRGAELAGLNKGARQVGHEGRGVMTITQESHIHKKLSHRLVIQKIPIRKSQWPSRSSWSLRLFCKVIVSLPNENAVGLTQNEVMRICDRVNPRRRGGI
jgi:hypothetical protein